MEFGFKQPPQAVILWLATAKRENGFSRRGLEIHTAAYSLEKLRRLMAADGSSFGVYSESE